jgi:menaquinone-9 beta-reductase
VEVKRVDVAIVGGGPAGSLLAALLASRGASTLLVERDVFPRDKVCGEFLSYDALPLLAERGLVATIDGAGAPAIERCRVMGRRTILEFGFPAAARGVSRAFFDDLLLRHARASGATVIEGATATMLVRGRQSQELLIQLGAETFTVEASVIAGAWGRWGRFDQQLGRTFIRNRSTRSFGFKRHYLAAKNCEVSTIDLYSFAHGYLGVNPVEDGRTNICGLVHASRLSGHKGRWDALVDELRNEEPRLDRLYGGHVAAQDRFIASEPVIFRARDAVESGVFMVGDASGIIDPLTGNGMAMAVQSAWLAAPILLSLLASPSHRAALEQRYRAEHARLFARRIRWSRLVAQMLSRPALLERALTVMGRQSIGELLLRSTRATSQQVDGLLRGLK